MVDRIVTYMGASFPFFSGPGAVLRQHLRGFSSEDHIVHSTLHWPSVETWS